MVSSQMAVQSVNQIRTVNELIKGIDDANLNDIRVFLSSVLKRFLIVGKFLYC